MGIFWGAGCGHLRRGIRGFAAVSTGIATLIATGSFSLLAGAKVVVPALYIAGDGDVVLDFPGVRQRIRDMAKIRSSATPNDRSAGLRALDPTGADSGGQYRHDRVSQAVVGEGDGARHRPGDPADPASSVRAPSLGREAERTSRAWGRARARRRAPVRSAGRRVALRSAAERPGEGPLTERTAGVQSVRRERVFLPHTCRSHSASGLTQLGGKATSARIAASSAIAPRAEIGLGLTRQQQRQWDPGTAAVCFGLQKRALSLPCRAAPPSRKCGGVIMATTGQREALSETRKRPIQPGAGVGGRCVAEQALFARRDCLVQ